MFVPEQQGCVGLTLSLFFLLEQVENQLDAARNAQLVVDPEEIVTHGMLAELQLMSNLLVRQSVGEQECDFLLPRSEYGSAGEVHGASRLGLFNRFEKIVK